MRRLPLFFLIFAISSATGQDSLLQLKRSFNVSWEINKGVEFGKKTNTLNDLVEITSGRSFGFNVGYNSLFYLNTFNRFGFGAELNGSLIRSRLNFQNPQGTLNPTPQSYDLGAITNFYLAVDLPCYYQNAIRFKNNNEIALSLGFKLRIIPFIANSGKQVKSYEADVNDGVNDFNNVYTVDYGMELSRVVVFYNLRFNYTTQLSNGKGLSFFTALYMGGFNNSIDVYYENFDNYENGVAYEYDGNDLLYLRLGMSHLNFGVSYLW
jgi:hypothetical protein